MTKGYELEERICEGGCGEKFKVLKTSNVRRARSNCERVCRKGAVAAGKPIASTHGDLDLSRDDMAEINRLARIMGVSK